MSEMSESDASLKGLYGLVDQAKAFGTLIVGAVHIGEAMSRLAEAGYENTLAANVISVTGTDIAVQYLPATARTSPRWMAYNVRTGERAEVSAG